MDLCCTCATAPSSSSSQTTSEKPRPEDRRLECCGRTVCGGCIQNNPRFATYCPFCQISSTPSALPQGLKDPPLYTSVPHKTTSTTEYSGAPPPYTPTSNRATASTSTDEKQGLIQDEKAIAEDTLHFLNHEHDSISSLSLRYGVPAPALRQANNITSDHLLLGRKTILIPGEYYKSGISLSPQPIDGEEEELRKGKIRRFMTSCKVSDYDIALLYLEQSDYDLAAAVQAYFDDEAWERDHPQHGKKGHGKVGNQRLRGPFWRGL